MILFTIGVAVTIAILIYLTAKHHKDDRRDDYS